MIKNKFLQEFGRIFSPLTDRQSQLLYQHAAVQPWTADT